VFCMIFLQLVCQCVSYCVFLLGSHVLLKTKSIASLQQQQQNKKLSMKYYSLLLLIVIGLLACNNEEQNLHSDSQDEAFNEFKEVFIDKLWKTHPEWAMYAGYYEYANVLPIPNDENQQKSLAFVQEMKDSIAHFELERLEINNRTDLKMIQNHLDYSSWNVNEFKEYEWNPASYNVGGSINKLLISNYAPLNERLLGMSEKLANVPAYYEAAKANLNRPSLEYTDLAIQQNEGALSVFGKKLQDSIKASLLNDNELYSLETNIDHAKKAITGYVDFLKEMKEKNKGNKDAFRDFRIGKEQFSKKFEYDIVSEYTAEEMYNKALAHKADLHHKMVKIAHEIWAKHMGDQEKPKEELKMVHELINKVAERHVTRADFIKSIRGQIPELTAFVKEKDLLYLDPTKPLKVRPTPKYMRGFAGASVSSPGPYDKDAPTFYNVTPLDHYTPEDAESYLKEYNHYVLQILNIHEAIPGHYAQLVYANKSPSLIKSILGNGAMIEGWAVYTELMMLEEGYGNHEPEMWLMYHKWNLRVTCNTIIDYGIHALAWDKEQVMNVLLNEAFQEKAEADGKWRRATVSQVQLCSYFSGFKEIYEFREELKKKEGDNFKLKDFHEQFLSYGSAPVKYVKELY
jgi:hypothetical protein